MRIDISNWEKTASEDRGVNAKEWVIDPNGTKEALYKETQIKDNSESTYADYAESIVSDICNLLGVPCAKIELVKRNDKNGCISYNFCNLEEKTEELIEIGIVIQNKRPHFNSKSMMDLETKECYGVEMILEALESISPNKTDFASMRKAFLADLLVDSITDHYDRNPANLSILRDKNGIKLSPKYDNGTSLSISVPEFALKGYLEKSDSEREVHENLRENIFSKIGYLGRKYVKYDDLETFVFNYYFDDVKDFISVIQEKLTDENIDKVLSQEKYSDLPATHKEIIRGKLRTNRDTMLERYATISKKIDIDKIIYNKNARKNFTTHVQKGTIPNILPEYSSCIGVEDTDSDYDLTLEKQIPDKIQTIVDITQLARYLEVPIVSLTKREKSLLKWTVIIENIQKATHDEKVLDRITDRLGFLKEDKDLIKSLIRGKFKDENDILEAREMIYGENGLGEQNMNLYFAKKIVDAAVMRKDIREERLESLRVYEQTMKDAAELESIVTEKIPVKARTLQKVGVSDKKEIIAIQYEVAKAYRNNERISTKEMIEMSKNLAANHLRDLKEEVKPGVFIAKSEVDEINKHTHVLEDGKKLVLFNGNTKLHESAMKMGADYYIQICDHISGDGVTMSMITKKGLRFPEKVDEFAKQMQDKHGEIIIYKTPEGPRTVSCFVVSTVANPNSKIPNTNVQEMSKKMLELFGEKEIKKDTSLEEK